MKKILICSKKESIRESVKLILGDTFPLILCESEKQCPDIIKGAEIGIIFIDMDISSKTEDEIKKLSSLSPDISIVIICKSNQISSASEAVRLGAKAYLVLPLKAEQVLSLCQKLSSKEPAQKKQR